MAFFTLSIAIHDNKVLTSYCISSQGGDKTEKALSISVRVIIHSETLIIEEM